jgi:hypothetical protein
MAGDDHVNYTLRPAKSVQRKMLAEAIRRLSHIADLASYRYVGFGSRFFTDFALFHRQLGISQMISIERDGGDTRRFYFNRPFRSVDIEFGHSNDVLPRLSWEVRTIAWLDYTGSLDSSVLADAAVFCRSALPGSVVAVTVNVGGGQMDGRRLERLEKNVGRAKVPAGVTEKELQADGMGAVCRRIFHNETLEALQVRNAALDPGDRVAYRQLFNFRYKDTAKMATFGGILFNEGTQPRVDECGFETLSFVRPAEEPFEIRVPSLTFKEIRRLDAQLPIVGSGKANSPGLTREDVEAYARIYRWFPVFSEVEL